jgi:hypothetical protein
MKFTRRASRLTIGLGAAAATVLVGATTLAATSASAAPSSPAGAARCVSGNTTVWTGEPGDGTAGTIFFEIQISNTGRHACTLQGYPGVSEVNGNGQQVGKPARHAGSKPLVTIPAGGTAHFVLGVEDPGAACPNAHPVTGHELKVYAPGQFNAEQTPFTASVCPHTVSLNVDAVHANAGIPNFSTS